MRDWLNKYGVYVAVVAIVVGMLAMFLRRGGGPAAASASGTKAFYFDEETGEESVRPVTDVPPLENKSGKPTIVQAVKYSVDGGKTSKVAYYMKYTAEGKEALERMNKTNESPNINIMANQMVRSPEVGSTWVPAQSPQGENLTGAFPSAEGTPVPVYPK